MRASQVMFSDDDWDKDFFSKHFDIDEELERGLKQHHFPTMELVVGLVVALGALVVIGLLCRCCCRRNTGRVLAPPPPPGPQPATAAYPQQQYTTATYPVTTVTTYPVASAAPYPTVTPYPTSSPYPAGGGAYPTAGAPYPTGGAPYPNAGAPYPTAGAPYPGATPYGHTPSAPDVNACPPSYDQVMMGQNETKQPPFNPNMPH